MLAWRRKHPRRYEDTVHALIVLLCCCNCQIHVDLHTKSFQINNMKAKFKETLERCDNLEQRVTEISKEKQVTEKK